MFWGLVKSLFWILFLISSAFNQTNDFLLQGDNYAREFNFHQALKKYQQAYQADPNNCTALWKIAETYINLGEEADKILQRQYYYLAQKWSKKAVQVCPDTANAHFFLAVSSGLIALYEGGKTKVELSKLVEKEAIKTLQIDPRHHGAYHVLGRWNREIASLDWFLKTFAKIVYGGLPSASFQKAVEYFKKAIEIKPDWIEHHKELGITYMKMKQWRLAKKEFETALQLPIQDHMDAFHKKQCREFLQQIEEKIH